MGTPPPQLSPVGDLRYSVPCGTQDTLAPVNPSAPASTYPGTMPTQEEADALVAQAIQKEIERHHTADSDRVNTQLDTMARRLEYLTTSDGSRFTANASVPMHPPQQFSAGYDSPVSIQSFLRSYNAYIRTALDGNPDCAKQFLYINLAGLADDRYFTEIMPVEHTLKYAQIEEKFKTCFENHHREQQAIAKLYHREHQPGEAVAKYGEDMHAMITHTNMSEDNKVLFFVKGLREGIKRLVTVKHPKTLSRP